MVKIIESADSVLARFLLGTVSFIFRRRSENAYISINCLYLSQVVPLDWWPLTRDCLAYGITVSILICIMHDEYVQWYEAFFLVLLYGVYICIMYYDKSIQNFAKGENIENSVLFLKSRCRNQPVHYALCFYIFLGSWKCVSEMLKKNEETAGNGVYAYIN